MFDTAAPSLPQGTIIRRRSRRWHGGVSVGALGSVIVLVLLVTIGPLIYDKDPTELDLTNRMAAPSGEHLLGTDPIGRDLAARMLEGGRVSLLAMLVAVAVSVVVGLIPGLLSGYFGGRTDRIVMRIADALISFPSLIIALSIVAVIGPGLTNVMLAVGLTNAPNFARIVRSAVVNVRSENYLEAARLIGCKHRWVLTKHVVPNVLPTMIVMVNLLGAQALLTEAGLSFIGLGVVAPQASWGGLLREGVEHLTVAPRLILLPGLAITMTVFALNVLGDSLRPSTDQ